MKTFAVKWRVEGIVFVNANDKETAADMFLDKPELFTNDDAEIVEVEEC